MSAVLPVSFTKPESFSGRVILITGATGGIGNALARACASNGASVILLDKDVPALERLYDKIIASGGTHPAIYPLDLEGATPQHYQELSATLEKEFGKLDGLVHCAAQIGALMPLQNFDAKLWHTLMQVNLNGPFLLTQACLPLLYKAPTASVIFSTAKMGRQGKAYWGAFAVANAAVENLVQTLADEVEANTSIRVNSIDPGEVRSRWFTLAYPGRDPNTVPAPESILPTYLYLLSESSREVRGQALSITPSN